MPPGPTCRPTAETAPRLLKTIRSSQKLSFRNCFGWCPWRFGHWSLSEQEVGEFADPSWHNEVQQTGQCGGPYSIGSGFNWCIETDTATPENLFSVGYYPIGTLVGLWDSRNQLNVPRSHRSYNFSDLKVGHHADGTGGANGFCNKIDAMMPCFLFLLAMSEDVEICVWHVWPLPSQLYRDGGIGEPGCVAGRSCPTAGGPGLNSTSFAGRIRTSCASINSLPLGYIEKNVQGIAGHMSIANSQEWLVSHWGCCCFLDRLRMRMEALPLPQTWRDVKSLNRVWPIDRW